VRWWAERDLTPPQRDTFAVLRDLVKFRYKIDPAELEGKVKLGDARKTSQLYPDLAGEVSLVVTSPPYLDVTDYAEDQWLRLWFLGGAATPMARLHKDDRLTNKEMYWKFLRQVWAGVEPLLAPKAKIVVRIGGRLERDEIEKGLRDSLKLAMPHRRLILRTEPVTSEVKGKQTNSFRPGAAESLEHDFVFSVS
jgi:hypothetical protein